MLHTSDAPEDMNLHDGVSLNLQPGKSSVQVLNINLVRYDLDKTKRSLSAFLGLGRYSSPSKYKYVKRSVTDKDPPGCPDFALCTAVTMPFAGLHFAVFFNAKISMISSFLSKLFLYAILNLLLRHFQVCAKHKSCA